MKNLSTFFLLPDILDISKADIPYILFKLKKVKTVRQYLKDNMLIAVKGNICSHHLSLIEIRDKTNS